MAVHLTAMSLLMAMAACSGQTLTLGDSMPRPYHFEVPQIVGSHAYRAGHTVLFVTYDEGEGGSSDDCATNESDVGCHVATVIVSPSTAAGRRSGELFNHYSLLRTSEELLGLPRLGQAAGAASMAKAFGLAQ